MSNPVERLTAALSDRYRIERELGAGGMATVYLARDLKHERQVAVKVLRPELAAALGPERFLREIKTTAQLNHPHILGLHDSGEADSFLYYVMPYVEGESLRDRLNREKQLPIDDALAIAKEVADALGYAHSRDVIHRDIKPENILLSGDHAVVADFGIAKAITAAGGEQITQTGFAVGTPTYMSPEQASADAELDGRSDMYSLACVLYEMLAGEPPHTGPTAQAIIAKRLATPVPSVRTVRDAIPVAIDQVLTKALAKVPADRFATATEFTHQLTAAEGEKASGGASRPLRRRIALVGAVAVALGVTTAVIRLSIGGGTDGLPHRVLVTPFENRSLDASLDPLGAMIADWVNNELLRTGLVQVVPTAAVLGDASLRDGDGNGVSRFSDLAAATGAEIVVSGAYYVVNDTLQIESNLIDVDGMKLLQSVNPARGFVAEPMAVVDAAKANIVAALALHVDPIMSVAGFFAGTPPSFEAYNHFVKGLRSFDHQNYREALAHFRRASEADTAYVAAKGLAAMMHWNLREFAEMDSVVNILSKSRHRLTKLQDMWLDYITAAARADWPAALDAMRQATTLVTPNTAEWYNLALAAMWTNRPSEALEAFENLSGWGPRDSALFFYWWYLASALHLVENHGDELEQARRGRERYPTALLLLNSEVQALAALGRVNDVERIVDETLARPDQLSQSAPSVMLVAARELDAHGNPQAARAMWDRVVRWYDVQPSDRQESARPRHWLGDALQFSGRYEEARVVFETHPNVGTRLSHMGVLAARLGRIDEAQQFSDSLAAMAGPGVFGGPTWSLALIAAALGERERAVRLLREAFTLGWQYGVGRHSDPDLASLRDYPPFQELMKPKG